MIPLIPGPFSGSTVEIRDTALLSFLGMHLDRVSRVRGSGLFRTWKMRNEGRHAGYNATMTDGRFSSIFPVQNSGPPLGFKIYFVEHDEHGHEEASSLFFV